MTINTAVESEILMFIEEHNRPNFLGIYPNIYRDDFSLVKLPLNELQVDMLMNYFFIFFKVDAGGYSCSNHFPRNRKILSKALFYFKTKRGKVKPITVKTLHDAVINGAWTGAE